MRYRGSHELRIDPVFRKKYIIGKRKDVFSFFALLFFSILFVYLLPSFISSIWLIFLLLLYIRSKDEPFWLAFFLVLSDGFLGFFGSYEAAIKIIPELPAIEASQFYILITIIKVFLKSGKAFVFYNKILFVLFFYVILLITIGQVVGLSGGLNVHLRVFKLTLPLLLFYSIPNLLQTKNDYERFFSFIFIIALSAFFSQIFNIITGMSPAEFADIRQIGKYSERYIIRGEGYRGFFNPNVIIISFFGALYYLSQRRLTFPASYLYFILAALYLTMFLSATRGWVISFGLVFILFFILIVRLKSSIILGFGAIIVTTWILVILQPKISNQLTFSTERIATVENLLEGDESAGGTLSRLTDRGPAVMNKWRESPWFGWGFSGEFFENVDGHVGNQNILLHSGLIGAFLLVYFLLFFGVEMFFSGKKASRSHIFTGGQFYVFIVFLLGWFILHSTSGQQFAFYKMPAGSIPQAVFFSLGALNYLEFRDTKNCTK